MKLAISSYSLRDHINREIPYDTFPQYAKDTYGVDAVEVCQFQIPRGDTARLQALKDGLGSAGVSLVSVPIDVGHISQPDAEKREFDLRLIELWLEAAAFLGAPIARVNSGDGDLQTAIASYQRLVDHGANVGIGVVMENHGGLSAEIETAKALLDAVPGLGTAPDFGNYREAEREEFLGLMAPRARIVHAKTLDFDADGKMSVYDIARCIDIVKEAGFSGHYSVEFEGKGDQLDGVRRSVDLIRTLVGA